MNKTFKLINLLIVVLLLVSVIFNINQHNSNKRTERALYDVSLDYRLTKYYRISSLNESLKKAISDHKLYVGPIESNLNYLQRDFNNLETIQREFVMMYNVLHSKADMQMSGLSNTRFTLTDVFQDISIYFDNLYNNHSAEIVNDGELYYFALDEKEINEIQIISNIMNELVIIHNEVNTENNGDTKKVWESLMVHNQEFIATEEIQMQFRKIVEAIIANNR